MTMIKTTKDKLDLLSEKVAKITGKEVEIVAGETYGAQEIQREMVAVDLEYYQQNYISTRPDDAEYTDDDGTGDDITTDFEAFDSLFVGKIRPPERPQKKTTKDKYPEFEDVYLSPSPK